jgi:polysaccharide biosynthesis transport protein
MPTELNPRSLPTVASPRLTAQPVHHVPGDDGGRFSIPEIVNALRRGVWIVIGTAAIVTFVVTGYTLMLPIEYAATAIVLVSPESAPMGVNVSQPLRPDIGRELGRLQHSAEIGRRVTDRLIEMGRLVDQQAYFPVLDETGVNGAPPDPAVVARRLRDRVSFQMMGEQAMIAIRAESTVPEEAARIANLYADEYQKSTRENSRARLAAARAFLEGQVERLGDELAQIDEYTVDFAQRRQLPARGDQGERLVAEAAAMRLRRDEAQFRRTQEEYALQVVSQELERVLPVGPAPQAPPGLEAEIVAYDQRIADLKLQAEVHYAANPALAGREHEVPALADLTRSIAHFEQRKAQLVAQLTAAIGTPREENGGYASALQVQRIEKQALVRGLGAEVAALDQRLRSYEGQLAGIPRQAVELDQLERRRGVVSTWYETSLQQLQETLIAEEAELGYVTVVAEAVVPTRPVAPNLLQNVILGLLLGLGLGIGAALAREGTSAQVRGPEELLSLGYTVLGVVPAMEERIKKSFRGRDTHEVDGRHVSTRLVTLLDPWSPQSEHYRLIRTGLSYVNGGGVPGAVLVTSPDSGAGKTVTASNLAVVLAQSGRRTILIDADLRRPRAAQMLGLSPEVGLAEILEKPEPWFGAHRSIWHLAPFQTGIPNLSFIGAGKATLPPSDILETGALAALLEILSTEFDVIVLDSPPVLVTTDTLHLASLASTTLMVVSARGTDRHELERAVRLLASVNVSIAGTIVNHLDVRDSSYTYYSDASGYYAHA